MQDLLDYSIHLALDTAQQIIQDYHRSDLSSKRKSDCSLVTDADLTASEYIYRSLQRFFPNDCIICEELSLLHRMFSFPSNLDC